MRDRTRYSFYLAALVIAGLAGISFIPPFSVAGVKLKRANIFSDLYTFADKHLPDADAGLRREDLDFIREMQDASNYAEEGEGINPEEGSGDPPSSANPATEVWELSGASKSANENREVNVNLENVTAIEDYSPEGAMNRFCGLLGTATSHRNVRIAFLGDSFIEGDIITADVREQLQGLYGGQGVGFVAVSSVTAEYRPTVRHTFRGWKDHQIANKKNVPEQLRDRFYVSGTISTPTSDAWAQYETANYRKYISEVPNLRFFYSSTANAPITFVVNGEHERTFAADTTGQLHQISISGQGFTSLRVSVPETEGFVAYGVSLEGDKGVLVDNYAIRSSTGLSLFGTSSSVNTAFNRMLGYDLIVLQYGLNIMSAEITGYSSYGEQFRNLVSYIKRCFPTAAVLVMGVADRSMQKDGQFVTMPAVAAMVKEQRAVAEDCGVAFWDTYRAMGGYNSMKRYAEWGWAAKDYTHLSFAGGRKIATELVKAIEYAKTGQGSPETHNENGLPEPPPLSVAPYGPTEAAGDQVHTETPAVEENEEPDGETINAGTEADADPESDIWEIAEPSTTSVQDSVLTDRPGPATEKNDSPAINPDTVVNYSEHGN